MPGLVPTTYLVMKKVSCPKVESAPRKSLNLKPAEAMRFKENLIETRHESLKRVRDGKAKHCGEDD